ncbi:hypothetical protein UA08_02354 [Talaromyces atroroseus]|uniref:Zn(2)-C6 fungal-type domain-containing protein n=1 Tax=Talaromyces atroroseus TaxID=1441469 RepID=A0A225ALH7_TALAT|nr:hypothetical protein UA08_02354 [Talaromyces atroroseus]OKL61760.1 hypothetical protein UA08_02354 [Talaromyces atroroseus]
MSQRRFHTKSRYGCLQCKQTRKKCDENRPRCGRCKRIGQDCSLSAGSPNLVFISSNLTTQRRRSRVGSPELQSESGLATSPTTSGGDFANSSPEEVSTSPSFTSMSESSAPNSYFTDAERDRLRLMHHYTLHTAPTLGQLSIPEGRDQTLWTDFAIELAFENDLVLHGLLSLSALHLALCGISKRKNTILAVHYHDMGLALFRLHLSNISEHNYNAIFAFNCIVMLYAFGIQRCSESTTNTIAKIHQILTLFANAKTITKSHIETLRSSPWSVLMLPEPFPSADQRLSDEVETMLAKLIQRASVTATTASRAATYLSAIQSLRYIFILMSTKRPGQVALVIFTVAAPSQFWDMVKDGDPLALAILANYAVILYWLRDNIWLEGWGKETIDAVHEALTPEWYDCISWALGKTERVIGAS